MHYLACHLYFPRVLSSQKPAIYMYAYAKLNILEPLLKHSVSSVFTAKYTICGTVVHSLVSGQNGS